MSRTKRNVPDVHKEMAEVFKRKSGPQIRPVSRTKEREEWEKEWKTEMGVENETSNQMCESY